MSNFDINVDRRTDGRTDGLTDGRTDGRTENRTPISHPATSRCDNNSRTMILSDHGTLQPLYNTVHYNTVWDITRFKDGSQNV